MNLGSKLGVFRCVPVPSGTKRKKHGINDSESPILTSSIDPMIHDPEPRGSVLGDETSQCSDLVLHCHTNTICWTSEDPGDGVLGTVYK
jgi:hypothetical protein